MVICAFDSQNSQKKTLKKLNINLVFSTLFDLIIDKTLTRDVKEFKFSNH